MFGNIGSTGAHYRMMLSMNGEEKKIYDKALAKYSIIVRCGGNSIEEIKECINIFEEFEDYEKCADLLEILKAYETKK
jgi:hypothetical protein